MGLLEQHQEFIHYETDKIEMGISEAKEFTVDKPHYHTKNLEINYILDGTVKVLHNGEETVFHQGDIFIIEKNERYITKLDKGSKILFIKTPGGNDKIIDTEFNNENWTKEF